MCSDFINLNKLTISVKLRSELNCDALIKKKNLHKLCPH